MASGFTGGITLVTDYIREKKRRTQEVFVLLSHPPGHAPVDFGEALGEIGGAQRKLYSFAMALPHSDAFFIKAYPAETTEACLAMATSRPSPSSAACRCRSCSTTPPSRWRRW
jgi:transposase